MTKRYNQQFYLEFYTGVGSRRTLYEKCNVVTPNVVAM